MNLGHFYFLTDQYFVDFQDEHLMRNKEIINGVIHDRPCFYSFKDDKTEIYWMIPFSSKVDKYHKIYTDKIARFNECDTIVFGEVLGHKKAFLIQNMCPVIDQYVNNEYIDNISKIPVRINGVLENELLTKAKKVLALRRRGVKLIFPDIFKIEGTLLTMLETEKEVAPADEKSF